MINSRGLLVLLYAGAIMFGLWLGARHGYSQTVDRSIDVTPYCEQIRATVASEGVKQTEADARKAGATDAQIEAGRKCIKAFQDRSKAK